MIKTNKRVVDDKPHHTASKTKKHRITQINTKEREKELLEWKHQDLKTVSQKESLG